MPHPQNKPAGLLEQDLPVFECISGSVNPRSEKNQVEFGSFRIVCEKRENKDYRTPPAFAAAVRRLCRLAEKQACPVVTNRAICRSLPSRSPCSSRSLPSRSLCSSRSLPSRNLCSTT